MFGTPLPDVGLMVYRFGLYSRSSSGSAGARRTTETKLKAIHLDVEEMDDRMRFRGGRSEPVGDYRARGYFDDELEEGHVLVEETDFLGTDADGNARRLRVVSKTGTALDGHMTLLLKSLD